MRVDITQQLVVPTHIVSDQPRPDLVLWSDLEKGVYFEALMAAWEDGAEEAYELDIQKWVKRRGQAGALD